MPIEGNNIYEKRRKSRYAMFGGESLMEYYFPFVEEDIEELPMSHPMGGLAEMPVVREIRAVSPRGPVF
ncbi:hypothetical protein Trydic_g7894 [Trypoxylus dichotomus]